MATSSLCVREADAEESTNRLLLLVPRRVGVRGDVPRDLADGPALPGLEGREENQEQPDSLPLVFQRG